MSSRREIKNSSLREGTVSLRDSVAGRARGLRENANNKKENKANADLVRLMRSNVFSFHRYAVPLPLGGRSATKANAELIRLMTSNIGSFHREWSLNGGTQGRCVLSERDKK